MAGRYNRSTERSGGRRRSAGPNGRIAAFIDRDNTIIEDCPYCKSRDQVRLLKGAAAGIRKLNLNGILAIVLTNQSGIGRGYFTLEQMQEVNDEMRRQLGLEGAAIDAIYFCPHRPEDMCSCRKPATGLIEMARRDFNTTDEFVIGDREEIDGEMARRASLKYGIVGSKTLLDIVDEMLVLYRKDR
ncbi:MAG: HAD family hydrolase [Thermoplasmata archaeon YP2-bin.285]|uniref:D,D-heptose 1,7-bisphosphate phosphatase n=1 Tax=Candidatus Sysuiplasma superficiale TaxID=2823368 RepID=A0A8J7YQJ2_9ARCH|nr:HAD family hydrolase [Candidatus Sysuiplasma superficiale]